MACACPRATSRATDPNARSEIGPVSCLGVLAGPLRDRAGGHGFDERAAPVRPDAQ
ncbi:Protein of unknown function [Micromonospora lupini str. Lupac 08]|uniref:Uncharacterized protein n=1 Tax=Micromonospora lupini str. Lupac 08 TaxID=1150864 RepID=I0L6T5_9ACTN|nr:Protein of unknown function [Micromonospora lupini str. Lupac 08]